MGVAWHRPDGLVVAGLVLVACTADPAAKLTPEQDQAATAFCQKTQTCTGGGDSEQCKRNIAVAIQIFPDPQAFAACIAGLDCAELQDEAAVEACADWNPASFVCSSSTLTGCSRGGKCASVDCTDVCKLVGYTFDHCGADATRGSDLCFCR